VTRPDSAVQKEEERVNRWGPHGSDRREKRRHDRNAQTRREVAFLANAPRLIRPGGLSSEGGGLRGWWAGVAKRGRLGQISRNLEIWQDLEKFYKEI
jgi:hypothetical protein